MKDVLTERNPEELERAVNALCILGRGYRDREAAEAVLQILEPYPLDSLPRREPIRELGTETEVGIVTMERFSTEEILVASAIRQLRRLSTDDILEPIIAGLQKDSPLLRRLIIEWLAEPPNGVDHAPGSIVGTPDPLREALLTSPDYIDTVLELWDELEEPSQYSAFQGFSDQVRGPQTEPKFVERLEALVDTPTSPFHLKATRLMTEINPRPELAGLFLNALENPDSVSPFLRDAWWAAESDAWIGLAQLAGQALDSAERIAVLLQSSKHQNRLDQVAIVAVPSTVRHQDRILITRRLMIYELLGRLGSDVPASVIEAIVRSMPERFGVAPDFEGDFGFEAVRPEFLIDSGKLTTRPVDHPQGNELGWDDMRAELTGSSLNAAVLALQRITGAPVPYADMPVIRLAPVPGESGSWTPDLEDESRRAMCRTRLPCRCCRSW